MYWEIDFESEEALYRQVCNQVIRAIAMSEIAAGDSLPSVRRLAGEIGINMHTVNKAYAVLREEGYIRMDRRQGAVVALSHDRERRLAASREELRMAAARALSRGLTPEEIVAMLEELCADFGAGRAARGRNGENE